PVVPVVNHNQDGKMNGSGRSGEVNYEPSGIAEIAQDPRYKGSNLPLAGTTQQRAIDRKQPFRQAGIYFRSLPERDKVDLVTALSGDLRKVRNDDNRYTMLSYFNKADSGLGGRLVKALGADGAKVKALSDKLSDD
ncbi:MAG: catalase, partial [Cupriavidus sp.]